MPVKFRVITHPSGKPWGPWRDTRNEAIEDAIREGLADRDEDNPETIYFDPLAEIEEANGSPYTDQDLWARVNEMVSQYQDEAGIFAAMRADRLEFEGDLDGARDWREIVRRIDRLLTNPEALQ